ncbi:MAG: S9 family peptidase, partial [Pseudomonadota bacterium]
MKLRTFPILPLFCTWHLVGVAAAQGGEDWPYPDDIPSPSPASVGLAGAEPTNVARYFKALGARSGDISPDGETVVYASSASGVPQVYAVSANGGAPRQITFGTGVSGFGFAPDGRVFVASDTDGNEREGYTLLSIDGRDEERLLAASDAFNVFGAFDDDGDRFVFASTRRTGIDFDIYLGTTAGEERRIFDGKFAFLPQAWRPGTDEVLVTETSGEDADLLHILNVETGTLATLFDPEVRSSYHDFVFAPDGSGFWMATNHGREFHALVYMNLVTYAQTGDAEASLSVVHSHDDRDIGDVALVGQTLVWTENDGGYSKLGALNIKNGREVKLPELMDGTYTLSAAKEAETLAVSIRGPQTPGTVVAIDLSGRRARARIVGHPTDGGLPIETFSAPEDVRFAAQDGVMLQGLLYRPETGAGEIPVVINVHGGPTAQARPR